MSKVIVEMEMPICCADCPCCICLNGMKPAYCKAVMVDDDNIVDGLMWKETDPNERPSWCPIKGVLSDEHGDLIDRDAYLKLLESYIESKRGVCENKEFIVALQAISKQIKCVKAVIAAERANDGNC